MDSHDFTILNALADPVMVVDRDYRIVFANRAAEAFYLHPDGDLVGRRCYELSHNCVEPCGGRCVHGVRCGHHEVFSSQRAFSTSHIHTLADGGERMLEITTSPVLAPDGGGVELIVQVLKDVTARHQAEAALRASEARWRALFEASPVPLVVADCSALKKCLNDMKVQSVGEIEACFAAQPERADACLAYVRFLAINQAVLNLLKVPSKEIFWDNIEKIVAKIPMHENPAGLVAMARGETSFTRELTVHDYSGEAVHCIFSWRVEPGHEEDYGRVLLSLVDISDRRRAEEELRGLRRRLGEAEEGERRRIALDIHDSVIQKIAALGIRLQMLKNSGGAAGARIDEVTTMAEDIGAELRRVTAGLRPQVLDDYGLLPALRWLAEEIGKRNGIKITVQGDDEAGRMPGTIETGLFRIAQEALSNVVRHSVSAAAVVELGRDGAGVLLRVRDFGQGFGGRGTEGPGLGLAGMRERALLLGGSLVVDSAPGRGTTITVEVPL